MGYYVYMDENGDAEGNYSLVSLCEVNAWRRNNQQEYSYDEISNGTKNSWLNLIEIM
jgi:hypothetical protein